MESPATYIICSTPRSGNHLLSDLLIATGVTGKPGEYLLCDEAGRLQNEVGPMAERYGKKDLEAFRRLVIELSRSPNGVFGVILMWPYFDTVVNNFRTLPSYQDLSPAAMMDKLFHHPKYIWLSRQDKVRQAVSWVKAKQTDVWIAPQNTKTQPSSTPRFDFFCIDHHRRQAIAADQNWEAYFRANNIRPLKILYEDLWSSKETITQQVLSFLAIPCPEELSYDTTQVRRQADQTNIQWAEQYLRLSRRPTMRLAAMLMQLLWRSGIGSPRQRLLTIQQRAQSR